MHHAKCQAGGITSWNQNCQEKYQQPQKCRWYHSNSRKQGGIKKPLDESESEKVVLKFSFQNMKNRVSGPITSWQRGGGKLKTVTGFIFLGPKTTVDSDCRYKIKRCLLLGREAITNLERVLKSRDIIFWQSSIWSNYGLSSSHVQRWELDPKNGWAPKNWHFQIVLERTLESPLDFKEIKPVNPKGNEPGILLEGLMLCSITLAT